jgi:hypothetical protein
MDSGVLGSGGSAAATALFAFARNTRWRSQSQGRHHSNRPGGGCRGHLGRVEHAWENLLEAFGANPPSNAHDDVAAVVVDELDAAV